MTDRTASSAARRPTEEAPREPTAAVLDGPALLERYRTVRRRSLALASPLSPEDQVVQSMPDASPTKWHLAHTAWFFETMVLTETPYYALFDPAYGFLFNSYYEALGPRQPRMHRGLITRPSVEAVRAYRAHVDAAMEARLAADALPTALLQRVALGLEHEEQHQELILTDALHLLAQNPLRPAYHEGFPTTPTAGGRMSFVEIPGGVVEIGTTVGDGLSAPFAFDNEGPRVRVYLQPYALSDRLVSNGEWLAFIEDGGYARPEFWLSEGWATVQAEGWTAPGYWETGEGGWRAFGPAGLRPLELDAPVTHVSYFEADAYARWRGLRLPTEAEWETAAVLRPAMLRQLYDAAWQWTASPYTAYPGFRSSPGALGEYNGKFMVNQMVLRGGSWATPPGHTRASYRNFFPPPARWQATGVRLAADANCGSAQA